MSQSPWEIAASSWEAVSNGLTPRREPLRRARPDDHDARGVPGAAWIAVA